MEEAVLHGGRVRGYGNLGPTACAPERVFRQRNHDRVISCSFGAQEAITPSNNGRSQCSYDHLHIPRKCLGARHLRLSERVSWAPARRLLLIASRIIMMISTAYKMQVVALNLSISEEKARTPTSRPRKNLKRHHKIVTRVSFVMDGFRSLRVHHVYHAPRTIRLIGVSRPITSH